MVTLFKHVLNGALAVGAFALLAGAGAALADPPSRVARMSFIRGDVGFQPAGTSQWANAVINRPLVAGDRLATDRDSRIELEIGAGSIRIDERSTFSLLDIDDSITQVELTDGTLNLSVRRLIRGQSYEVDTPTLAFVVSEPGDYRIDVSPDGDSTMVTVFSGRGDVYGEYNASYRVRDGRSYRFNDSRLRDYEVLDIPRADNFDRFCQERNRRYERSVSTRYVSDELVGYADLDAYGSWSTVPTYGSVWYPRGVRSDWAPYRDGHWAWIDPWGWSWIDDQPWGFAPSHYGRWAQINSRWGWVPGPRQVRPVYAPALVAFVGGGNWGLSISSNPVGWFPLGPRDVYRPWYDNSRDYFTRVNTHNTIITNITVVNVYNDYSRGRPHRGDYAYRQDQRAFTAVPGNVFAGARPVGRSRLNVGADAFGRGDVVNTVAITPVAASLVARGDGRVHRGDAARFDRRVVARNAPPAQVLPFAQREAIIRDNGNRSPGMDKLRGRDRGDRAGRANEEQRIRVVDRDASAKPVDIPVAADLPGNRGDRRVEGRADRAEAVERKADGRNDRRNDDNTDRRAEREKVRDGADARNADDQALPSTRYSPAARERQTRTPEARDQADDVERIDREGRQVRPVDRGNADRDNADRNRGRADDAENAQKAREARSVEARQQAAEQQAERERERAERQQETERENAAKQARQRGDDEQRRARQQALEDRSRLKTPDAIDPPINLPPQREQRQQRDDSAQREAEQIRRNEMQEQRAQAMEQQRAVESERMQAQQQERAEQEQRAQAREQQRAVENERKQAQQQERADQEQRAQAKEQQRAAASERMQAQQQERAEQANRAQAEQMQRQQEQQVRQAQRQEQQMEMQQRQQQAQQEQMQQQQQQQQQQMQQQNQAEQQAAPPQQQRVDRRQQKRDAREEKDDNEDKKDR